MTLELGRNSNRRRLERALQAAGLGEFEWDVARDIYIVSDRMAAITGLRAGQMPAEHGGAFDRHVHPDDLAAVQARRAKDLANGDTFETRFRWMRPGDGRTIWIRLTGVFLRDNKGRATQMTGAVQDVTETHREEEQRQQLMAELDHRVKNVLAAVQSLAQQTARRTTSIRGFVETFGGRLKAMAAANELLTAARWRGAAIEHLAAAELGALAPSQANWAGPELFLTPRAANALSLALHELTTNAVKFGALTTENGQVDVRWAARPGGGFELTWIETGGPRVTPPGRTGFGSTLLEQVTGHELNGDIQVDYHPAGVQVRVRAGPQAMAARPEIVPEAPLVRAEDPPPAPLAPATLDGARVLIVEDAVLLALELETSLSEAGATVVGPAYELEEAMALLDQPIDAAVLDANLNGRSVTPVAEALLRRNVPFVFATGYGETGGAPGGFDAPVIRKPYDVTQVVAAVAELLGAR